MYVYATQQIYRGAFVVPPPNAWLIPTAQGPLQARMVFAKIRFAHLCVVCFYPFTLDQSKYLSLSPLPMFVVRTQSGDETCAYREGSQQGIGELRGTPRLKLGDTPGFRLTKVGSMYRLEFLVNDAVIYTMNDIPVESDYHPCVTISNNVRMRIRPPGTSHCW